MLTHTEKTVSFKAKVRCWGRHAGLLVMTRGPKMAQSWFVNLGEVQHLTLMLAPQGEGWALGYADEKNHFVARAYFDEKFEAEEALRAIQRALLRGSTSGKRWGRRIHRALSSFLLLLLSGLLVFFVFTGAVMIGSKNESVKPAKATVQRALGLPTGQPVSADDFLAPSRP
ncbi:MAG: hypothetical protein FWF24_00035 [Alphaproteobacteria bacterium]|nr:hypothetical protein [Alphaproteobacteria bacterium]